MGGFNERQRTGRDMLGELFAREEGRADANRILSHAKIRANQRAATLLAASQCPPDLVEFGIRHNIP